MELFILAGILITAMATVDLPEQPAGARGRHG